MWKVFAYNFFRSGICGYYFSQWHSTQQSDAGDLLQEIIKKSDRIRWVYSVGNYFIMAARKLNKIVFKVMWHKEAIEEFTREEFKRRWCSSEGNGSGSGCVNSVSDVCGKVFQATNRRDP
jgi:hypothetical protein